ncbi:MAG: hypothetical protein A2Y33_07835 [Spirochaetes bacterium GWF1_51_8]|nr:MAG: hypothetical protein A2Y33_07835 [Spirochaetes bacterium GWF1_51_8]
MNVVWTIGAGGANARFDGANYSQVKSYLIFVSPTNGTGDFGIMTISASPITISAVSAGTVLPQSNVSINLTLSGSKCAEEAVYVRYTTNNWTSSSFVQASGSGTAYSAVIPAMPGGTVVRYYALTTSASSGDLAANPDLLCISINNNGAANYSYTVPKTTWHTIVIDGNNDFYTNECIVTTSASSGYSNWITWDNSYFYIGYKGADIAHDASADCVLVVYISTNTNTGSAYGVKYNNQLHVLPFRADYVFNFINNYTWNSASWNGSAWNWNSPFTIITLTDLFRTGNFIEFRVSKSGLKNPAYLDVYLQMVNQAGGTEWTYGAIPNNTLTDGFKANPSNFISFKTNIWKMSKTPWSTPYKSFDPVPPISNVLLYPANNQTVYSNYSIILTNKAIDKIGIYKVEFYTNYNALYGTVYVTNYNTNYTLSISAGILKPGTNHFYTIAYDTRNLKYSATNTVIVKANNPPAKPVLTIPANGDMNFYLLKPRYKWAPVSDPDGNSVTNYQIIVSPNASLASPLFNYTIVSTASNFLTPFTNYLQNNVTYYWSVRASDGIIWGPWSDTNSFRVNPSYIKLDGSLSEWNTAVGGVNTDFITNGQWMWNDKTNDAFSTGDALPYDHLDLLKFGVTANDKCLFFMFTVPDLSDDVTYDSPRPYISVAIDTNKVSGSGVNKMVESEVGTPAASRWEMEIIANVDGTGYYTVTGVTTNFHECGENWITHTANPGLGEIAIPWEELGFSGIPETLRIVVDTGRVVDGLGIYNLQQVGGAVNFLDCVSTNNVSAADEFSDGENNVYMDIYFNTNGRIIESRFQVTCPSSALAGMPFPVVVKALAPLGGTVYDFSRAIIPQTFSGGASVIVSNTPWKNGVATNFVVINYLGSNKLIIRDAQFTNITGTSGWIVIYRPDVVVNEVMFDPSGANNDGQWIELFNRESGPIYLNGWAIHDYDGAYPMYKITNTVVLPSSNYIVLRDGAGVNDLNFTDGRGILYGEWGAGMLSVSQDEIGLYCSSTMENQYTLLDFIAYGADAGAGDDLAVTAGIWTSGAFASIANCTSNSSLVLLPDGDDNNLASDWTVDHSATPKWGNKFVILQNLSNISQSAGGYAGSIILAYQIELPDPENDTLTAGDRLSNIVICLGGTITVNNILEAKLWNDNGAGQFNYGWRNNSATNNLLLGTGVYSNTVNGFVFSNLANNLIANSPYGGKMTLYFSLKLATNAAAAQTIKPYILADSIIMQSTYPEATGPKDGALTNSAAQTVKSGYFTVNEFTDGGWAGANDYLYQFIEIYNNSSASVTPSGWNISTVQGNDNLAFYRESSFGAGQFLLIAGGGTTVQAFTNFYTENQSAPVMTSADTKIGANGLVTADTPCIIRENTTIIAIIDFTNSYTALSNTVEIIDPWGTHLPANYQASSAKHGTPGYLNGFRFIEMNLLNISNYSLDIGTTNNLILDFYIPNNNGSADTLQMITIKNNGTAIDTDITLKLWKDSASSGYDGDEALVGTFVYLGSYRWSWSGSTPVPNTGAVTKWRFFITADILAGVLDGNTVKLAIEGLTPANPAPYSHTFNTGIQLASWNDGPVDGAVSNTSYQICGVPYLTLVKTVQSIQVMSTNLALPGALLLYQISYSSLSNGRAYNVVLYDKVPLNTHYYTNYMGTAAGWTVQFSSNTSPNQGYNSADYHSNPTNALWVRWKKGLVYPSEDGRTFYLGVTID